MKTLKNWSLMFLIGMLILIIATSERVWGQTQQEDPLRPTGPTNSEMAWKGWENWKALSESARENLAPEIVDAINKIGPGINRALTFSENLVDYNRTCGGSAPLATEPLCQALQPGGYIPPQRSPLGEILHGLIDRAGTQNAQAQQAAAMLLALRQSLGVAANTPSTTSHLLNAVYAQVPGCFPPGCRVLQTKPAGIAPLMNDILSFFEQTGGTKTSTAASRLRALGYGQTAL